LAGGVDAGVYDLSAEVENPRAQEQVDTRIIGRSEAIEDRFSYAVLLTDMMTSCGGSLITMDVVLTAAHCSIDLTQMSAFFGIHDLNNLVGEAFAVREQVPHHEYNETLIYYDVMLVFLEGASTTENVITVKLNSSPSVPSVGQDVTVMGWGDTDINFMIPSEPVVS
jgi:secreted trypsin-like serine protease